MLQSDRFKTKSVPPQHTCLLVIKKVLLRNGSHGHVAAMLPQGEPDRACPACRACWVPTFADSQRGKIG